MFNFDPKDPSTTVRKAFLAECLFHITTVPLLTHPKQYMSLFILRPSDITLFGIFMIRIFAGLIIFGMTPALLHGLSSAEWAISSRRATYIMLAGTEVFCIPLLLAELSRGGDLAKGAVLSTKATLVLLGVLGLPFAFRIYTLYISPEMMGKYKGKAQ